MDKKRIIYAVIFVLISIGVGFLIYRVFFYKPKLPEVVVPPEELVPAVFPEVEEVVERPPVVPPEVLPVAEEIPAVLPPVPVERPPAVERAVDTLVLDATSDAVGKAKFYNQSDGQFYRLQKDGSIKKLSEQVFFNVDKVTWSPVQDEAIIEYPDGANIYYNFNTKKQVTLPKHWEEFTFSPLGDKIAAKSMALSPESRWLITANPDGKSVSAVEAMGNNAGKVTVDWSPAGQVVALSRTGEVLGGDRQEVLFVGLHGENFRSIVVEGRDMRSQWSPDGNKLLYSVFSARNDFKPELWVVNAQGEDIGADRRLLGLNTWADKCAFADKRFAYCAVPAALETGAGFAPALASQTPDRIYKIDLQTSLKNEMATDGEHTIDSMFVGDNGQTLYFTDKNQAGLFSLSL